MPTQSFDGQLSLESSATINGDNVVSRDLDGEAVILNLESGVYFGLNDAGSRIWALIQEHKSLRKVLEVMEREYEAAPDVLQADLLKLVGQLHEHGLVRLN